MKPLEYTHVYVIESLNPADVQTDTFLYNDTIRPRMMQKNAENRCTLRMPTNRMEFFQALESIRLATVHELANPIIHFEMHGSEHGLHLANNETVTWDELAFFLLQINGICGNNLLVSMATCMGGYIFKTINPAAWTPFWGFLGAYNTVTGEEVLANYTGFYDELLSSNNFASALQALQIANPEGISPFRFNNTHYVFQEAFKNYERAHLTDERVNERMENIFEQCRPLPEFRHWDDAKIRNYAYDLIKDEKGLMKKHLKRKFFLLDKYPEHEQYYPEINNNHAA